MRAGGDVLAAGDVGAAGDVALRLAGDMHAARTERAGWVVRAAGNVRA